MNRRLIIPRLRTIGRAANQLFLLASGYGMAKKTGRQLVISKDWKYKNYFEWDSWIEEKEGIEQGIDVVEPGFHYCEEFFDNSLEEVRIAGYFQSERYWRENEEDVRKLLKWNPNFVMKLALRNDNTAFKKPVIGIHIRRGDYVNNPNYYQLPLLYYILALEEFFPGWMDNYNILIFSDDITWCKTHFQGDNIFFSEGNSDVEDLCLLSFCHHQILSNSSFSWWGAYLSDNFLGKKVIHPAHMFDGELKKSHKMKDFWKNGWIEFNHEGKFLDLRDVTFTIPVHYDHQDREENLNTVLTYILQNFDTNIIVGEQGGDEFSYVDCGKNTTWMEFPEMDVFHRTKMLNDMCKASKGEIIVNYDADIIVPIIQILQAVKLCRKGVGMVYPYDGRFARIPRELQSEPLHAFDVSKFPGSREYDPKSVGGCVFFRKDVFIKNGMENEYFISYGPEDTERWERMEKLGVEIKRIKGPLYHLDHWVGPNSSGMNPYFGRNYEQLEYIRNLTKEQLEEYIKSWKWKINI